MRTLGSHGVRSPMTCERMIGHGKRWGANGSALAKQVLRDTLRQGDLAECSGCGPHLVRWRRHQGVDVDHDISVSARAECEISSAHARADVVGG